MKRNSLTILALAAALSLSLWGCGSSRDSGDSEVQGPDVVPQAQTVGITNCAQCHEALKADWLAGPHGNAGQSPDVVTGSAPACVQCHNPNGDGNLMPAAFGVGASAVVGCETCHGGGQYHSGLGPIPTPTPDFTVCSSCHNDTIPHFGTDQGGLFAQSKHAAGEAVAGRATLYARCSMCHSDEGFRQYAQVHARQGGYDYLNQAFASEPAKESWSVVQCRTCHDSHTGQLRAAPGGGFSQEFNLCTSCHMVFVTPTGDLDPAVYGTSIADLDAGKLEYHHPLANKYGSYEGIISDTHFAGAFPTFTEDADGNHIYAAHEAKVGYGIDVTAADACTSCHNAHSTKFVWE